MSWTLVNIATGGTGTYSNPSYGDFTINGAGNGLAGTSDSTTMVYLTSSGNVEMITK